MSSQRDLAQIRSPNGIDEGVDRRYFMTVDADRLEHGRWIYSAWKHIRRYQSAVASRFGATALAGKAGDLLGRLRVPSQSPGEMRRA